jgi:NitT/TauT family transport system ATP-binding protein
VLEIDVSKNYGSRKVIEEVRFSVEEGEFVCIVGESGSGKTTLLRIIAGLEDYEGNIRFRGGGIAKVGFVFQEDRLLPWRTAIENVMFGLEIMGYDKERARSISKRALDLVGLSGFENHYPHQLSGGQRQRVAFARAIAIEPEIFLMDEPFASLDEITRQRLQEELSKIWLKELRTVLFVTHSIEEAVFLADRVIVLSGLPSKVVGDVRIDLKRPRDRSSSAFFHYENMVRRILAGIV